MLSLSVLDQSPIRSDSTPTDAIRETVRLAEAVDALGYRRYWVAEHHNTAGLAGSAPEIMIGQIAARTRRLRVGSGGIMLNHYSSLKVAETFRVLEALYPGRIDLGLGRAPGSDQITALALAPTRAQVPIEEFPRQIHDLIAYVHDDLPEGHAFGRVHAMPRGETAPEIWLLGSSDQSAIMAAYFGRAFSFAHFISGEGGQEVMQLYRDRFRPSPQLAQPAGSIGVHVICADTEDEASRLAMCRDLWRVRNERGMRAPLPTLDEALAHEYSEWERNRIAYNRMRQVIGGPERVRHELETLAAEYGVAEIVVVTITPDYASRLRSYELLAEMFAPEHAG